MTVPRISTAASKRHLATLWFIGSGALFFLVLVQTSLNVYGDKNGEVFTWLLPTIMPSLSLVVGALVLDWAKGQHAVPPLSSYLFQATFWLSAGYLASVLAVFLLRPLSTLEPIQILRQANIWLGPFQGLVSATMGAFFSNSAQERTTSGTTPESGQEQPSP